MERNNGETFQKQALLTFIQPLGTLCFEKNLILGVGLGLRPEEAGQGVQKIFGSIECGQGQANLWGRCCYTSSEMTMGPPKGGFFVCFLSAGRGMERKSWDPSLPLPRIEEKLDVLVLLCHLLLQHLAGHVGYSQRVVSTHTGFYFSLELCWWELETKSHSTQLVSRETAPGLPSCDSSIF